MSVGCGLVLRFVRTVPLNAFVLCCCIYLDANDSYVCLNSFVSDNCAIEFRIKLSVSIIATSKRFCAFFQVRLLIHHQVTILLFMM